MRACVSAIFEYQSRHKGYGRSWLGQGGEIFLIYTLPIVDSAGNTINTAKIRKKWSIVYHVCPLNLRPSDYFFF